MKKIISVISILFICVFAFPQTPGDIWRSFSEKQKVSFIVGFLTGIQYSYERINSSIDTGMMSSKSESVDNQTKSNLKIKIEGARIAQNAVRNSVLILSKEHPKYWLFLLDTFYTKKENDNVQIYSAIAQIFTDYETK